MLFECMVIPVMVMMDVAVTLAVAVEVAVAAWELVIMVNTNRDSLSWDNLEQFLSNL